jgi:glucan phosphoethanolaminetransferase (alkaline phosphatase superfamily)
MVVILTLSEAEGEGSLYFVVAIVSVVLLLLLLLCSSPLSHHTREVEACVQKVAASFMVQLWCNVIQTFFSAYKQQNPRHSSSRTTSTWC